MTAEGVVLHKEFLPWTEDHTDAALCIWEHALSSQVQGIEDVFDWLRDGEGTAAARRQCILLAQDCHSSYLLACTMGYDTSFDWEFVPSWVRLVMSITEEHELTACWINYIGLEIYREFRLEHKAVSG